MTLQLQKPSLNVTITLKKDYLLYQSKKLRFARKKKSKKDYERNALYLC